MELLKYPAITRTELAEIQVAIDLIIELTPLFPATEKIFLEYVAAASELEELKPHISSENYKRRMREVNVLQDLAEEQASKALSTSRKARKILVVVQKILEGKRTSLQMGPMR